MVLPCWLSKCCLQANFQGDPGIKHWGFEAVDKELCFGVIRLKAFLGSRKIHLSLSGRISILSDYTQRKFIGSVEKTPQVLP